MTDVFDLPVFPDADVFPMMSDDELQELAADIEENGLREPVVVAEVADDDGELLPMLIDGRNRRAACQIAEVKPETRMLNGEDPTAFVLSANIHRRNLSTGQRAMAVAMIRPEPEEATESGKKGGRGKKGAINGGLSHQRLADARAVFAYSKEIAKAVMIGEKPLAAAVDEVKQSQGSVRSDRTRLARLRDERPDLADMVQAELLSLDKAEEQAKAEADELKQQKWAVTMEIIDGLRPFDRNPETASEAIEFFDYGLVETRGEKISPAKIRRAAEYLTNLADAMEATE